MCPQTRNRQYSSWSSSSLKPSPQPPLEAWSALMPKLMKPLHPWRRRKRTGFRQQYRHAVMPSPVRTLNSKREEGTVLLLPLM